MRTPFIFREHGRPQRPHVFDSVALALALAQVQLPVLVPALVERPGTVMLLLRRLRTSHAGSTPKR